MQASIYSTQVRTIQCFFKFSTLKVCIESVTENLFLYTVWIKSFILFYLFYTFKQSLKSGHQIPKFNFRLPCSCSQKL
jgi:hypothetical protein